MLKLPNSVRETFKHRMGEFLKTLNISDRDRTSCEIEIVRLVLQIQNGPGSTVIRKSAFALGIIEEFTFFKNHYLDFSQYLNRSLWILVPKFIRDGEIHDNQFVAQDIDYCISVICQNTSGISLSDITARCSSLKSAVEPFPTVLTVSKGAARCPLVFPRPGRFLRNAGRLKEMKALAEDLVRINKDMASLSAKKPNPAFDVGFMQIDDKWTTGQGKRRHLGEYVNSKVGTVKFLWDYDPAFEQEDFEQELIVEVLKVFNAYPKSKGLKAGLDENSEASIRNRVEMYIEMAVNNKVNNFKEFYTCENRQRVTNSHSSLYKEKKKIKKLMMKMANEIAAMAKDSNVLAAHEAHLLQEHSAESEHVEDGEEGDSTDVVVVPTGLTAEEKVKVLAELKQAEKDISNKIKYTETDYSSTVTPMVNLDESGEESEMPLNGEERGFNTGPTSPYSPHAIENQAWTNEVVERLRIDGEEKIARFVEIIVHEHDPAFDAWANKEGVNTNNPALRARGAKEFLGLSSKELKASRLSGWLKSNLG